MVIMAVTCSVTVAGESGVQVVTEIALAFYATKDFGRNKQIAKTVRLQVFNLYAFLAMLTVNLASSGWGANLLGFSERLINHQTCGSVGHMFDGDQHPKLVPDHLWKIEYNDTATLSLRTMAHGSVWKVMIPLYCWLSVMVFIQLLPMEEGGHAPEKDKRDQELEKIVMVRGTKEQVFTPRWKCGKSRYECKVRRIDRWRLTTRSQKLFHVDLGYWFILMCMFNIFFLVSFQFKDMISALTFMCIYYVCLVQCYLKTSSFKKFRNPLKLTVEDELLATRAKKDKIHAKSGAKKRVDGPEGDSEEGRGTPVFSRDEKEQAQVIVGGKKWKDAQGRHVSFMERVCVHAPLAFTLGVSTYLLLLMINLYLLTTKWTVR